ncbi:MAG: Ig-like domain-containing protein [Bacteroidales bacterium]|nr:Ig-like domain-containing protein [Bacteroidales bacterium]
MKRTLLFFFSLLALILPVSVHAELSLVLLNEEMEEAENNGTLTALQGQQIYIVTGSFFDGSTSSVKESTTANVYLDDDHDYYYPVERDTNLGNNAFVFTLPTDIPSGSYTVMFFGGEFYAGGYDGVEADMDDTNGWTAITLEVGEGVQKDPFSWTSENTEIIFSPYNGYASEAFPDSEKGYSNVMMAVLENNEEVEVTVTGNPGDIVFKGPDGAVLPTISGCEYVSSMTFFPNANGGADRTVFKHIQVSFEGESATTPGEYTLTFPANFFKVEDELNPEPITVTYTVKGGVWDDWTYSFVDNVGTPVTTNPNGILIKNSEGKTITVANASLITISSSNPDATPISTSGTTWNNFAKAVWITFSNPLSDFGTYTVTIGEGALSIDGKENPELTATLEVDYPPFYGPEFEPAEMTDLDELPSTIIVKFPHANGTISVNGNGTVNGESLMLLGGNTNEVTIYSSWITGEGGALDGKLPKNGIYNFVIPASSISVNGVYNTSDIKFTYTLKVDNSDPLAVGTFTPAWENVTFESITEDIVLTFSTSDNAQITIAEGAEITVNGVNVTEQVTAGEGKITFPQALFADVPDSYKFVINVPAGALVIGENTNEDAFTATYSITEPAGLMKVNYELSTVVDSTGAYFSQSQFGEISDIVSFEIKPDFDWQGSGSMFSPQYNVQINEDLLSKLTLVNENGDEFHPSSLTRLGSYASAGRSVRVTFSPAVNVPGIYTVTIPEGFYAAVENNVENPFAAQKFENLFTIEGSKINYFGDSKIIAPAEESATVTEISNFVIEYPNLTPEDAKDVTITTYDDNTGVTYISVFYNGTNSSKEVALSSVEFNNDGNLVISFATQTAPGEYSLAIYEGALMYDGVTNTGKTYSERFTIKYNYFSDVRFLEPAGSLFIDEPVQDFELRVESKNGQSVKFVGETSDITVTNEEGEEFEVDASSIKVDPMTQNLKFSTAEPLTATGTYTATVKAGAIQIKDDLSLEDFTKTFTLKPAYFKEASISAPAADGAFESVNRFEVSFPNFEGNLTDKIQPAINSNAENMITITKGEQTWYPIANTIGIEDNKLVFETEPFILSGEYTLTVPAYTVTVDGQNNETMTRVFTINQRAFPELTILPEGVEDCVRSLDYVTVNFASDVRTVAENNNKVTVKVGGEDVEATLDQSGLNLTIPCEQTTLGSVAIEIPAGVLTVGVGATLNELIEINYTVVPEFMSRPTLEPANEETIVNLNNMIVRYSSATCPEGLAPLEEENMRKIEVTDGTDTWYGTLSEFVEGYTTRVDIKFADAEGNPVDLYQEGTYNVTIPAGVFVDARTAGMALQTTNNVIRATYTIKELPYYFQGSVWTPAKGEEVTSLTDITIEFPNRKGVDADGNDYEYDVELNPDNTASVTVNDEPVEASIVDNKLVIKADCNIEGEYDVVVPADFVTIHSVGNVKATASYSVVKPNYFSGATVAPAAGTVTSLKEFIVSFPNKGEFTPVLGKADITVTRSKGTPVVAAGSINADGQLVVTLDEEITLGGSYTLNIPKGAVSIDDLPNAAAITAVYSIAKDDYYAGAALTSPEPGIVETLRDFKAEFPGKLDFMPQLKVAASALTVKNASGQTAATVASASIDAEGNLVFSLNAEVSAAGTYTVSIPAGAVSIDDVLNATAIEATYIIEVKTDAAWWQRTVVNPAGSSLRTEPVLVPELGIMTVAFPGNVTVLASDAKISRENLEAEETAEVAPFMSMGDSATLNFETTDNQGVYALTIPEAMFFSETAGKNPEMVYYYQIEALSAADFWTAEYTPADGAEGLKSISTISVNFPNKRGDIVLGSETAFSVTSGETTVSGNARINGETITFELEKAVTAEGEYTVTLPAGILVAARSKYGEFPGATLTYTIDPLPIDEAAFEGAKWEKDTDESFSGGRIQLPNRPSNLRVALAGNVSDVTATTPDGETINATYVGSYSEGMVVYFPETTAAGVYTVSFPEGVLALCEMDQYYNADPDKKVSLNPAFSLTFSVEELAPLEVNYTFKVVDATGAQVVSTEATELNGIQAVIVDTGEFISWGTSSLYKQAYLTNGTDTYYFSEIFGAGNTGYRLKLGQTVKTPGTYSLYVPEGLIKIDDRIVPEVNEAGLFTIIVSTADPEFWENVTFDPEDGATVRSISTVAATFTGDVTRGESYKVTLVNTTTGTQVSLKNLYVNGNEAMMEFPSTTESGEYTLTIAEGTFVNGTDPSPEFVLSYTIEAATADSYYEGAIWTPAEGDVIEALRNGTVSVKFPNSDGWVSEGDIIYTAKLVNETDGTVYEYSWSDINSDYDGGDIVFNNGNDITAPGEYLLTVPEGAWESTKGVAGVSPAFELRFTIKVQEAPGIEGMLDNYEADPEDGASFGKFADQIRITFPDLGDEYGFFLNAYSVSLTDQQGNEYQASLDADDFEGEAGAATSLVVKVLAEEYPAGLYTLTIPAGSAQLCSRDDWNGVYEVFNAEIKLTYHVTEGVGIFSVLDEAETYTVVDYAGRVLLRDGSAEDVMNLAAGLYIINGKRVNIRK